MTFYDPETSQHPEVDTYNFFHQPEEEVPGSEGAAATPDLYADTPAETTAGETLSYVEACMAESN